MAFTSVKHDSLFIVCLLFATLPCAACIPGRALAREPPDARRPPLPLAAPFASLPRAPGKPGGALVHGLSDALRVLLPPVPGLNLLQQFLDIQVVWAIVQKVKQTFDDSVDVASFFAARKVLERLWLYTCTVVVHRLVEPPRLFQFITTQAVLAAWLVCTGGQVAHAFELQQVLERFGLYLLQLLQSTLRKSADNDVISRHK